MKLEFKSNNRNTLQICKIQAHGAGKTFLALDKIRTYIIFMQQLIYMTSILKCSLFIDLWQKLVIFRFGKMVQWLRILVALIGCVDLMLDSHKSISNDLLFHRMQNIFLPIIFTLYLCGAQTYIQEQTHTNKIKYVLKNQVCIFQ